MSTPTEKAVLDLVASGKLDEMMKEIRDGILTEEVVAAFRLPVPISQLARLAKLYPGDYAMEQRGEWLLVRKTKS